MSYLYHAPGPYASTVLDYIQSDTAQLHTSNKLEYGPNWRYWSSPLTYRMNSSGYRMNHDLDRTDWSSYIAFFGCSYTMGIGLPLEDTFSWKIASSMESDYINAATGGAAPNLVVMNLVRLLSRAPNKPKAIVINWPPLHRITYWHDNQPVSMLPNYSQNSPADSYWRTAYEATILEDSHVNNTFAHLVETAAALAKLSNIPLVQVSTSLTHLGPLAHSDCFRQHPSITYIPTGREFLNSVQLRSEDSLNHLHARDLFTLPSGRLHAHPGILHQNLVHSHVLEALAA